MKAPRQVKAIFAGLLISSSVLPVAMAEDIEIYTTPSANVSGVKPNLLFLIDGSSDMLATSTVGVSYDPTTTYTGTCDSQYVYYTDDGSVPDCDGNGQNAADFFNSAALVCDNAVLTTEYILGVDGLLETDGSGNLTGATQVVDGPLLSSGIYNDNFAQYGEVGNGGNAADAWIVVDTSTSAERALTVDCEADSGVHGIDSASGAKYIDDSSKYTATTPAADHAVWGESGSNLTLYSANYVNYANDASLGTTTSSHFDQIRNAIEYVVDTNGAVNIGMMVYDQKDGGANDPGSEGGGILYELQDGSSPRGNFIPQMFALNAEGGTPLSEAYYEALLYYGGKSVDYGSDANPPLVGSATESGNTEYATPIELSCQKNYIIVASNGKATDDDIDSTRQAYLGADGFTTGQCSDTITSNDTSDDNIFTAITNADGSAGATSSGLTNDNCLDELAYWAANNDVAELAIDEHTGDQNITTHTVGFGYGDTSSHQQISGTQLLKDTAEQGDGDFYEASNEEELREAFDDIIAKALKVNSTFSSPAVSVNAFNRSVHLSDLYFTLFKPTDGNHWEGNLKKYKLEFKDDPNDATSKIPFIADQNSAEAIDPDTGFFKETVTSYWSDVVDGKEVGDGGAANDFTTARTVYTYTGTYSGIAPAVSGDLTSLSNRITMLPSENTSLTDAMLDIVTETANGDEVVTGTSYRETLINWSAGIDALSDYGVTDSYDDVRLQMGDPLHAEPALVQYKDIDQNSATIDLVAYVATNDGYLHAFNVDDGSELWSFVPQELLPNLKVAMEDIGGDKLYGLDGSVVAWLNDDNGDGDLLDANDHAYLYVTMRRGGKNIYALDVTDKTNPELLWVIKGGEGSYTELAQTWSTVTLGKVKHSGVDKDVLIFGGGYDEDQDSASVTTEDDEGRTVYIADAVTGARLWTAGADATTPTANMNFSIPARINILDISGDGYTDRLYAVDMGGQMFRFDIDNSNNNSLSSNIIGGRIADLAEASTPIANRLAINARRFYYPPDITLVDADDGPYHGLVLSSGYRANPLDDTIQDRIYMIKDRNTAAITDVSNYNYNPDGSGPLDEGDLNNATSNLAGGDASSDTIRDAALANLTSAEGWYIYLDDEDNSGSWLGEKGLSEPLIIEGVAIVTTYTPNLTVSTTSCDPNIGLGKIYFLNILDATPAFPSDLDVRSERHVELTRGGIPPSPNVIITEGGVPTLCIGTECQKADFGLGVRKTYWYEVSQ